MDMEKKINLYAKCDHIQRTKPSNEVDEDTLKSLGQGFDLLPLFEKGLFEHLFIQHYSLQRNEQLKCRWAEYVKNIEFRVFAPFQFPDIRDLHFYNGQVRIHPAATVIRQDHRMKQKPGPGVDYGGQMPIPQEAIMKRGNPVNVKRPKTAGKKQNGGKSCNLKSDDNAKK